MGDAFYNRLFFFYLRLFLLIPIYVCGAMSKQKHSHTFKHTHSLVKAQFLGTGDPLIAPFLTFY